MKLSRDILRGLVWEGSGDGWEVVSNEYSYRSRWASHHVLVISNGDGRLWQIEYSKALTELQNERPFDYAGDEVELTEVFPISVMVRRFVKVFPGETQEIPQTERL